MSNLLKALIQKGKPFNDAPFIYLIAIIIFSVLIVVEIANGEVSLRFGPSVPLASTKGYIYLGFQFAFLLLAIALFTYKFRNNLRD